MKLNPFVKVQVASYFLSVWTLQELKNEPYFKQLHFYALALNDKLREHELLKVMHSCDLELNKHWIEVKMKQEKHILTNTKIQNT